MPYKYKLRKTARQVSNNELLSDVKRVYKKQGKISAAIYLNNGGLYSILAYNNRFGSWNNVMQKLNFKINQRKEPYTKKELFENLESVWNNLGYQPAPNQMKQPLSKISITPYIKTFNSWRQACIKFIKHKKGNVKYEKVKKTSTQKSITYKEKLQIFSRDNYTCVLCGKSPAKGDAVTLHLDHIKPISKGGKNNIDNLRTACHKCNLTRNNDQSIK